MRPTRILRHDLGQLDDRTAREVLRTAQKDVEYFVRVYAPRARRAGLDLDDLTVVAKTLALEAHVTWDPTRGTTRRTWRARLLRYRLRDVCALPLRDPATADSSDDQARADAFGADQRIPGPEQRREVVDQLALASELLEHLAPRRRRIVMAHLEGRTFVSIAEEVGVCHQYIAREFKLGIASLRALVDVDERLSA